MAFGKKKLGSWGKMSLADFSAAGHISALDYVGDIDWQSKPIIKEWYAKIKSRPAFRNAGLLTDLVPGFVPAGHYSDLDFSMKILDFKSQLQQIASDAGFSAVGITDPLKVDQTIKEKFRDFIKKDWNAGMDWLEKGSTNE